MTSDGPTRRHPRWRLRREFKWGLSIFAVVLIVEYGVLPRLGQASNSIHRVGSVNVAYVMAGLLLEAASLVTFALLTFTVLPQCVVKRWRLFQINMSSLAVSHVVPGGTAPGTALAYRLITQQGVSGTDTGFALAIQGVGSAVVLNMIFWASLLVSLFTNGYNSLYAVAAGAGVVLMGTFATVAILLTRGHQRVFDTALKWGESIPFLDAHRLAQALSRVADRLRTLFRDRNLLRKAIGWASANWLLDASALWLSIAAFHKVLNPVDLLVAYGLANILAAIPITPGGLGVVEGVLITALTGFGVHDAAIPVLLYRLWNFWLPIPIGGLAYLSLRFRGEAWRQRFRAVREEVSEKYDGDEEAEDVETRPHSTDTPRTFEASTGSLSGTASSTEQDLPESATTTAADRFDPDH